MQSETNEDLLHGAAQIAAYLRISQASLYQRVRQGVVPVGRFGKKLLASRSALDEHLARLARGGFVPVHRPPADVASPQPPAPQRGRGRPRKEA